MRNEYKEKIASKIAARYADLEVRIMQDIVRRIKKTGEITSTADWQINRLKILVQKFLNKWTIFLFCSILFSSNQKEH